MEKESDKHTKRYLMIELSCNQKACSPCTYPNCQRYARQLTKNKKLAESVKPVASHELAIAPMPKVSPGVDKKDHSHAVNRFILTELSCTNSKCKPCTYPNCQRFARGKKNVKIPKGSPVVNVIELKEDKGLKKLIEKPASHGEKSS